MATIWREFGIIGVLLVVSIGGYLYVQRTDTDIVGAMMDGLSERLLSLVSNPSARDSTAITLAALRRDVEDRAVSPEQLEKLAANVLNLEASGSHLDHDQAAMVIHLALDEASTLNADRLETENLPPKPPKPSRSDLAKSARRVERAMSIYSSVRRASPPDTSLADVPPVRFYADNGLRVVIDERLRSVIAEQVNAELEVEHDLIHWQARLAESVQADRRKRRSEAETLRHLASVHSGDRAIAHEVHMLADLRNLEARGLVSAGSTDSLSTILERHIGRLLNKNLDLAMQEAAFDLRSIRTAQAVVDSMAATVIMTPAVSPRSSNQP